MDQHTNITISDLWIIAATFFGPIAAVQAQRIVEWFRDRKNRRRFVFEQLMLTRGDQLSQEHQRALNMIEYTFDGVPNVINAWHNYFDYLDRKVPHDPTGAVPQGLLGEMLKQMSKVTGYKFDDRTIKTGHYRPQAHVDHDLQQAAINRGLSEVLAGSRSLKMDVTDFPFVQSAVDAQVDLQTKLASTITADGEMKVVVTPTPPPPPRRGLRDLHSGNS